MEETVSALSSDMAAAFNILIKKSKDFKKELENINTGARSYKECSTEEEKVMQLKELNKFLHSTLKVLSIDSTIELKSDVISNEKVKETQNDLSEEIVNRKHREKFSTVAYLSNLVEEVLKSDSQAESDLDIYKKKIIEQLQYLQLYEDAIKNIIVKQKSVLEKTVASKIELREAKQTYKASLSVRKEKDKEEMSKKLGPEYESDLMSTNKRIAKLNFMRILIMRLLIYGNIEFAQYEEFITLIQKTRFPYSLDSFKE